ncbi:diguanylate cyclase [Bacillus tamaricis]|uniref:Diguanylate cyclase n=1 Tax=Evansella tamaricis TaxID=2069301 RepID=A0ABS6JDI3_9BACI|nr:diguanylate cyclase [Evansella tamaricis]
MFCGFMSSFMMLIPFRYNEFIFDLRSVPIIYATYCWGWKAGLVSAVLPVIYRIYLGGLDPLTLWTGIAVNNILPVLICVYFFYREKIHATTYLKYTSIIWISMLTSIIYYVTGRSILGIPLLDFSQISFGKMIFTVLTLLIFTYMTNEHINNLITQAKLEHLSVYDSLTGLLNIRGFKEKAKKWLNGGKNTSYLMMADIDYFKTYNDTYGHPAGDIVLEKIGNTFRESLQDQGFVGRYGGEEFIFLIRECPNGDILQLANFIRLNVENSLFPGQETQPSGKLTVSIGVSIYSGVETLGELIQQADIALYESKQSGKNKVTLYTNNLEVQQLYSS